MSEAQKILEIKNLSYIYRGDWLISKIRALKDVSLEVYGGEAFGFLGANGAGKTTTIKCVLNIIRPSAGEIKLFGQDSKLTHCRSQVGYLPEQPYFYDHLSVEETLRFFAILAGIARNKVSAQVDETLESVRLTARRKSRMRELSKGLTQRVALAQAIIAKPKLLILDEPFSGLDPLGRKHFRELLLKLKSEGCALFMSSHILSDVEQICDRASVMVQGELKGIVRINELSAATSAGKAALSPLEGYFLKLVEMENTE